MDVKPGDRVRRRINTEGGSLLPPEEGVVVYVHPLGRYFTLEFIFTRPDGRTTRVREAYILPREAGDDGMPPRRPKQGAVAQDCPPPRGRWVSHLGDR